MEPVYECLAGDEGAPSAEGAASSKRDDDDASFCSSAASGEVQVEWPATSIMLARGVIDDAVLASYDRYARRNGHKLWRRCESAAATDDDDETDTESGRESENTDDVAASLSHMHCCTAVESRTIRKLLDYVSLGIDEAVDAFVQKYKFFNLISTRDEHRVFRFAAGDHCDEHCECTGLTGDETGAARRLCVVSFLAGGDAVGGEIEFTYQGISVRGSRGDVLVFPACPLHPNLTTAVESGEVVYVVTYVL